MGSFLLYMYVIYFLNKYDSCFHGCSLICDYDACFKVDGGIPALEKRRAVGALCHLQRALEEKPLLLLEMSTCSKTLLSEQNRLANSVALTTDKGCRALLQKKRVELHTLMQQLWNIFINFLPDLRPLSDVAEVLPVPAFETDGGLEEVDELEEVNQWETVEEDEVLESEEEDIDSEDSDSYYEELGMIL